MCLFYIEYLETWWTQFTNSWLRWWLEMFFDWTSIDVGLSSVTCSLSLCLPLILRGYSLAFVLSSELLLSANKKIFYVDCLIFILYKQKYHVIKRRIILVYLIIKHFYGLLNFCNFWNELLEWRIATSFIWWALVSNRKSTLSNLLHA